MPTLSTAQITGIVFLGMILSGAVIVEYLSESYYCEPEDNVKECLRLSGSGITCYYLTAPDITKGDRCTGGVWQPLNKHLPDIIEITAPDSVSAEKSFSTDNCIVKGEYCYCNPRGNLDNKRLCS
ncbi:hypothetical protein LCGC14_3169660 [marine sediment metagenome]|uniref:Uncharacterized protein n=1 Tax=marine sediment metagenome TaxID=412755 RepID=A0A0F8XKQ6_9ZZZZ